MEGVKSFLDFVRYCIDEQQCVPTIKSWNALFLFMQQQALVGIGFRGLKRMNAAGVEVPRDIVLQWYAMSEQIKLANQKMNRIAVDLVNFFREEGFRTCVLKGQGNALYYPDPYLRMSGDIDIWVEGGGECCSSFFPTPFLLFKGLLSSCGCRFLSRGGGRGALPSFIHEQLDS